MKAAYLYTINRRLEVNNNIAYNTMKKAGIFIIIVGLGLTFLTSFTSFPNDKSQVSKKTELPTEKPNNVNWYPLFSISIFVVGAVVIGRTSNIS